MFLKYISNFSNTVYLNTYANLIYYGIPENIHLSQPAYYTSHVYKYNAYLNSVFTDGHVSVSFIFNFLHDRLECMLLTLDKRLSVWTNSLAECSKQFDEFLP
jgi:hypothetical protein